jgi:sugar/nucleoside kinase (ribokinase family)
MTHIVVIGSLNMDLIACEFAVRTAALSVTRFGAQPSVPSRLEADSYIQRTE